MKSYNAEVPHNYQDPIHERQRAEKLREKAHKARVLQLAGAQSREAQARRAEARALKAELEKEAAAAQKATASPPAAEKRKREEEQESEEEDSTTASNKKTKTDTAIAKSFAEEFADSPFALSPGQIESITRTPSSKDKSPSTVVTSPETEELKVQAQRAASAQNNKNLKIATSGKASEEVSTPTSSEVEKQKRKEAKDSVVNTIETTASNPTTKEMPPPTLSKIAEGKRPDWVDPPITNNNSAADDDDGTKFNELDEMLIGDKSMPGQKRNREEEQDAADKNQDDEDQELSTNKKRKIDPASKNQAQPSATKAPTSPRGGSRSYVSGRFLLKGKNHRAGKTIHERWSSFAGKGATGETSPPPTKIPTTETPMSENPTTEPLNIDAPIIDTLTTEAPTTEAPKADSRPRKRKLVRKSELLASSRAQPIDLDTKDAYMTVGQIVDGSSSGTPPPTLSRASKKPSVAPDTKRVQPKTGQVLKDKRTNPQGGNRGEAPKATGENTTGGSAPSQGRVSGSAPASDIGKNVSKGREGDKVSTSSIKKILPRPGLPHKHSAIHNAYHSNRSTPAVQNSGSSVNTAASSAVSRKRNAESEASNSAKKIKHSPPTGLYNYNKAGYFNSVLQCFHVTPAIRGKYSRGRGTYNYMDPTALMRRDRYEKVGKGAKKGVVRDKATFRRWLDTGKNVYAFKEEFGLFLGEMSKLSNDTLISFALHQLFALKVAPGMDGEANLDPADMIDPLLASLSKNEKAYVTFFGGLNPFEFSFGRKILCDCGHIEWESSGSQMRQNSLYATSLPGVTKIEDCITRAHPDIQHKETWFPTCSKCGSNEMTRSRMIEGEAPQNLIVRLNRFSNKGKKYNDKVPFSLDLDLSKYCKQETMYKLHAVCLHEGDDLDSGDFKALICGEDGDWYLVQDDVVENVFNLKKEIRELSEEGYLFFYTKTKG